MAESETPAQTAAKSKNKFAIPDFFEERKYRALYCAPLSTNAPLYTKFYGLKTYSTESKADEAARADIEERGFDLESVRARYELPPDNIAWEYKEFEPASSRGPGEG